MARAQQQRSDRPPTETLRICLTGDVMAGRGIDHILPHPCDPELRENYVKSALEYTRMAEAANGLIPAPVAFSYIWGAALAEIERVRPDVRIINLETSITRSNGFAPKGINYRMSPENADCLAVAAIDCCTLANNHVLDFGYGGLLDTLATLDRLHIKIAGAGHSAAEAGTPAIIDVAGRARVLVLSFACISSGVPRNWAAKLDRPGLNVLPDMSESTVARICEQILRLRRPRDVIVVSMHWGPNWGYEVPEPHRRFAHALIEQANVSVVHGHSSHHAKAVELYRNRLVLYGCGDFLNDYEGIEGYETYRGDLSLLYVVDVDLSNKDVVAIEATPFQMRRFQLTRAPEQDRRWLQQRLDRESQAYGTVIELSDEGRLRVTQAALAAVRNCR